MAEKYPFCCQWGPVTPEGTCGLVDSRPTGNVHCKCRHAGLSVALGGVAPARARGAVAVTRCLSRWHCGIIAPIHGVLQGTPRRWRAHVAASACPWAWQQAPLASESRRIGIGPEAS